MKAAYHSQLVIYAEIIVEAGDICLVSAHGICDSFAAAGAERFALFATVGVSDETSAFKTPYFHIQPSFLCERFIRFAHQCQKNMILLPSKEIVFNLFTFGSCLQFHSNSFEVQ